MTVWIETETGTMVRAEAFDVFRVVLGGSAGPQIVAENVYMHVTVAEGPEDEMRAKLHMLGMLLRGEARSRDDQLRAELRAHVLEPPHEDPDAGHRAD